MNTKLLFVLALMGLIAFGLAKRTSAGGKGHESREEDGDETAAGTEPSSSPDLSSGNSTLAERNDGDADGSTHAKSHSGHHQESSSTHSGRHNHHHQRQQRTHAHGRQ